jgi:PRC-barrel domain protein
MTILSRVYPTLVLLTGALLISPAASQTAPTPAQPSARDAVHENNLSQDHRAETRIEFKNVRSVLGIEVRSSHEKNIGRIVDLLTDPSRGVEAAVVEFGGFLGIGTRKIAIAWSDLRFQTEGNQLVATLDIPRDQLRAAPDYKPDKPAIVTKVTEPLMPSTQEPPRTITEPPAPPQEKPQSKRKRQPRHNLY